MSEKERNKSIYEIARLLKDNTTILKERGMLYYVLFSLALLLFLLLQLAIYIELIPDLKENQTWEVYILLLCMFSVSLVILRWEQRFSEKMKRLYERSQLLCGELSDIIDWKTMRKRQVHRLLNDDLQEPINSFYNYCLSLLCPFYGGKRLRNVLFLFFLIETVGMFVYSFIVII